MIDSHGIYTTANNLVLANGTNNPFTLAENTGVEIFYMDSFKSLLGMYTAQFRIRSIFINQNMDENLMRIVIAHELGHDVLHRALAKNGLKEFELFRMNNRTEYEANALAAHILIDTNEFLEYTRNGYDIFSISKCMNTQINLLLIKLQELQRLGYDLRMPMEAQGDFLKEIEPNNADFYM